MGSIQLTKAYNTLELRAELAVAGLADATILPAINWTLPNGTIDAQPAKVDFTVSNPSAVQAVVTAHKPTKTDAKDKADKESAYLASNSLIQDLIARITALENKPK